MACGSHVFNNQVLTLMCSQPCHLHLSEPFHHRAGGTEKQPQLFPRVQRAVCGCATPTPRLHSDRGWGCWWRCSTLSTGLRLQVRGKFSTANSPCLIPVFFTDPLRILRKDPGGSRVGSGGCGSGAGVAGAPSPGGAGREAVGAERQSPPTGADFGKEGKCGSCHPRAVRRPPAP